MSRFASLFPLPALLAVLGAGAVSASEGSGAALFESNETIAITLHGPFRQIARDRSEEPSWHAGRLGYDAPEGRHHEIDIRLRARGKSRRDYKICQFPPLRLDFDREQAAGSPFAGQNKLKLVTHCQNRKSFEQHVWREYLVYRIYNSIEADCSFRVRPVRVVYTDTGRSSRRVEPRAGFLIEDRGDMAKRCGGKVSRAEQPSRDELEPDATSVYELFQYLIANTDWSTIRGPDGERCCHNGVLVRRDNLHVPVPYDFDASGFVDAPYSAPSESLGIRSVTTRLFRGFCRPRAQMERAAQIFQAQRETVFSLIREHPHLTRHTVETTTRFVERFYATLEDPVEFERAILDACR